MFPLGQMPSFAFDEEMKKQALREAIRNAGFGMMGAAMNGAGTGEAFARGLLGGAQHYQTAPQRAMKQWEDGLDLQNKWLSANKSAAELQKMGREQADYTKQQDFFGMLTNPGRAAMAGGGGPSVTNFNTAQNYQANPSAMLADPRIGIQALTAGVDPAKLGAIAQNARPYKMEGGNFYVNPMTGQREYLPSIDRNLTMDSQGRAMAIPGAPEALGQIARAQEGAKAAFDLVDVPQGDGTMRKMTRSAYINQQNQPAQQARTYIAPDDQAAQQLAAMLSKTGQPFSVRIAGQQFSEQPQSGQLGVTQRPEELAQNNALAQYDVKNYSQAQEDAQIARRSRPRVQRMVSLMDSGQLTTDKLSNVRETIGGYLSAMGMANDKQQAALANIQNLRTAISELTLSAPKPPGPASNLDMQLLGDSVGRLTDDTQALRLNLAFMDAQFERQEEYAAHMRKYRAAGKLDQAEEDWVNGKGSESTWLKKNLRRYLPVVENAKGQKAYRLPDGRFVLVNDPELR